MKLRNNINKDSYFTKNDIVKVPRTTFPRNKDKKLSFNAGLMVPLHCEEIEPGDSMSLKMNSVVRFASPMIRPVMDDEIFEAWAFFVPSRLLDDDFEKMIANYRDNMSYTEDQKLTLSQMRLLKSGFAIGSAGDYLGLPAGLGDSAELSDTAISLLPFRGLAKIWDEWFRDENLQSPIFVEHPGHLDVVNVNKLGNYETDLVLGGALPPLNKRHDLFSSCLPAPQRGEPVTLNLGGQAKIYGDLPDKSVFINRVGGKNEDAVPYTKEAMFSGATNSVKEAIFLPRDTSVGSFTHVNGATSSYLAHEWDAGTTVGEGNQINRYYTFGDHWYNDGKEDHPAPIYADLSGVSGISVNDLRVLFQTQKLKEQDARYGSRYNEYLLGSWGVVNGDARLQRSEFLGKLSFNLSVNQTVQTSQTTQDSAQSNVSAYSLTANARHLFTKSFTEHGYLFIVGGCRVKSHTFSQKIDKMWSKLSRLQFYNPVFANLGEQPVLNQEISWNGSSSDRDVFGYNEYGYELRYTTNEACGYMRAGIKDSLSVWSYAESYDSAPTLSPDWIREDNSMLERSLALPNQHHFIADIYFENKATRPIPLHSVPGLVDHSGKLII